MPDFELALALAFCGSLTSWTVHAVLPCLAAFAAFVFAFTFPRISSPGSSLQCLCSSLLWWGIKGCHLSCDSLCLTSFIPGSCNVSGLFDGCPQSVCRLCTLTMFCLTTGAPQCLCAYKAWGLRAAQEKTWFFLTLSVQFTCLSKKESQLLKRCTLACATLTCGCWLKFSITSFGVYEFFLQCSFFIRLNILSQSLFVLPLTRKIALATSQTFLLARQRSIWSTIWFLFWPPQLQSSNVSYHLEKSHHKKVACQ